MRFLVALVIVWVAFCFVAPAGLIIYGKVRAWQRRRFDTAATLKADRIMGLPAGFADSLDSGGDEFRAAFDAHTAAALRLVESPAPVVPLPPRPRLHVVPAQRSAVE